MIKKILKTIKTVFYPEGYSCIFCGKEIVSDEDRYLSTCEECSCSLVYNGEEKVCNVCAGNIENQTDALCQDCLTNPPPYNKLYSVFVYKDTVRKTVLLYKEHGHRYLAKYVARYIADYLSTQHVRADIICPIPASREAMTSRGFSHIVEICEELSAALQIPMHKLLLRTPFVNRQKGKTRREREKNIIGSFAFDMTLDEELYKDKTVLIIDDVVTSGATIAEAARVIAENGVSEVLAASFARTRM
ncbi:MAG: ComF family protein [Christensenellaceae bacterium]|nr:ComF family protein [Christensenellaceae bacterium]